MAALVSALCLHSHGLISLGNAACDAYLYLKSSDGLFGCPWAIDPICSPLAFRWNN